MCKLNNQLLNVEKPENWFQIHFEEMVLVISKYQEKNGYKPKIRAYSSNNSNDYILKIGEDLFFCKNLREICEILFPIYRDIKTQNDTDALNNYKLKMIEREKNEND